ncbi:MAG: response regulator transcription factor [Clostridia bacterium]
MQLKILVADDDVIFRELVCDILKKEGYSSEQACDGQAALDVFFACDDFDLIILDVMMPIYDGWSVLKAIREYSEVPILMLTALGDEKHEVFGLQKGADDYIAKPFGYEVFVARINALVRNVKLHRLTEITFGEIKIKQETRSVFVNQHAIYLNRKEYNLLLYFVKNKGRILTREQILDNLWGYDFAGDMRTIDTHIKTLRAKLTSCGGMLKTIRGVGYMFEEDKL